MTQDKELLEAHRTKCPIQPKQKVLISLCKAQLLSKGVFESEGAYRDHLEDRFGVRSIKELADDEADNFITEMVRLGAVIIKSKKRGSRSRRPQAPNLTHMVTVQQLDEIGRLKKDIIWRLSDGFERWKYKKFGLDKIRTSKEAQKVIEGLKGMRAGQQRKYQQQKATQTEEGPF